MQLEKSTETLLNFNNRLSSLIQTRALNIKLLEKTPQNIFIAMVIGKAIKTHNAVMILCLNGYGEDAVVLVRTLFEMLLDVMYITKIDNQEMLGRYNDYSWVIKNNYLISFSKMGDSVVDNETRKNIENEASRVQKKYGYLSYRGWSGKNGWQMAEEVGLLADYEIIYKLMSSFAHTDALGLDNYATLEKSNNFKIDMYPSGKNLDTALPLAFHYLFKITEKWNSMLNLDLYYDLKKLEEEYAVAVQAV